LRPRKSDEEMRKKKKEGADVGRYNPTTGRSLLRAWRARRKGGMVTKFS